MQINKNLLVGIGIGVLVYYLYISNKKKVQQPAVEKPKLRGSIPPPINMGSVPPPPKDIKELSQSERNAIKEVIKDNQPKLGDVVDTREGKFQFKRVVVGGVVGIRNMWVRATPEGLLNTL